jgi:hypothetical protein
MIGCEFLVTRSVSEERTAASLTLRVTNSTPMSLSRIDSQALSGRTSKQRAGGTGILASLTV